MKEYTREDYRKHIFSLADGWADVKNNKKFRKSTWKLAMKYIDILKQNLDLPKPLILPADDRNLNLDWNLKGRYTLLISVYTNRFRKGFVDYYGGFINYYGDEDGIKKEVRGVNEKFETTIFKIVRWYKKIEKK